MSSSASTDYENLGKKLLKVNLQDIYTAGIEPVYSEPKTEVLTITRSKPCHDY